MKVLFISLPGSVHAAHWIGHLGDQGWDLHFFPATPAELHPNLSGVTIHGSGPRAAAGKMPRVLSRVAEFRGGTRIAGWLGSVVPGWSERSWRLAQLIRRLKPDVVHSLETQRAGYLALDARGFMGTRRFPRWMHSCWGNDLYLFWQRPEHRDRIRAVLEHCDYLTTDNERDVKLASDYGFRGKLLGVFVGPGGYDLPAVTESRMPPPVATRRKIVVKGYQSREWGGRALVALQAIHRCADVLQDYEIVVCPDTNPGVGPVIRHIGNVTGLNIRGVSGLRYEDWLKDMGGSRVYIGLSLSDGTPCSMIEAMIMGALPVQSDTVSTAEWIEHGRNGLLVSPEDAAGVETAIRRAVTDDALVKSAARFNEQLMRERVDIGVVKPRILAAYRSVFGSLD